MPTIHILNLKLFFFRKMRKRMINEKTQKFFVYLSKKIC